MIMRRDECFWVRLLRRRILWTMIFWRNSDVPGRGSSVVITVIRPRQIWLRGLFDEQEIVDIDEAGLYVIVDRRFGRTYFSFSYVI